jgi:hypothetical protein
MSDDERAQILKMVEDGKITPEQAVTLMNALDDDGGEGIEVGAGDPSVVGFAASEQEQPHPEPDPEFERKVNKFRRLWIIPLVVGIIFTVFGAYWMYSAMMSSGFGPWFLCAWVPFLMGVGVVALAAVSKTSRWLYVDVKQKPGESPRRIMFGLPVPVALLRWGMRNFGHNIPAEHRDKADYAMKAVFEDDAFKEPFLVDVKEDDGTHVQVYIG